MQFKTSAASAFFTAALVVAFFHQATPAAAQCGKASWYAEHGRTASGERLKAGSRTAAHRTLPFGTLVEVQNLRNGRTVVVRINDRGPFIKGRVIDLARSAANDIGMVSSGTARVRLSVLDGNTKSPAKMCG